MEPSQKKAKMTNNNKYKQQNKKKYFQSKKQFLQAGQRGFFATCNINEKACVRECYNLLNFYADALYGPEQEEAADKKPDNDTTEQVKAPESDKEANKPTASDEEDDDLEAAAAKCRQTFTQRKVRFQNVDTGTTNCVFIRTLLDNPVALGKHIINDISTTGKSQSRFVLRLVPIEAVCRANMQDIINAAGPLFDKHFLKEATSYGIIFNHRYNQQIKREQVINQLAELVNSKNVDNKVDLKQAKKSIIVEVLRGWCLLSVIDNYLDCKKYNLAELANPSEKKAKEGDDGKSETDKEVLKSDGDGAKEGDSKSKEDSEEDDLKSKKTEKSNEDSKLDKSKEDSTLDKTEKSSEDPESDKSSDK